jgi:protein-tyrosine phosphatase
MRVCPEFPNSYWVVPGVFAAGEYPGSVSAEDAREKLAHLLRSGIDLFIDLTERNELKPYDSVLFQQAAEGDPRAGYLRMPICDMSVPTAAEMSAILNAIDAAVEAGRKVYLHCWGGIGRTGTVVGCYLVRHGLDGPAALERVAELFAVMPKAIYYQSPQTDTQCAFVRDWIESDADAAAPPEAQS